MPLVVLALLYGSRQTWLPSLCTFLIQSEQPSPADAVVVLAGDSYGLRIQKGGDLVRAGFAPVALVSGPHGHYDHDESDLAIEFANRHGYPNTLFVAAPNHSNSTENEATALLEEIRKRNYKKVLVVTSNYHTRRAGRIWHRLADRSIEVHMVAARDQDVVPECWWDNREARKKLFFEWMKTLTGPLGI